jgi:hypothetical protein
MAGFTQKTIKMETNDFSHFYQKAKGQTTLVAPVFIIGSYRSGTSVLTWSLGQHSNILPLEETNWIYKLGVYLDCLYSLGTSNGQNSHLSGMGMTRINFYKSFGTLIHSFMLENQVNYLRSALKLHFKKNNSALADLKKMTRIEDFAMFSETNDLFALIRSKQDTKSRWIDGTPENSHFVYCLNMMFPKAKFIFLIRNPVKVAHSLMNFATVSGQGFNYEEENAYHQWYVLTESCYYALKAFGSGKVLLVQQEHLISQPEEIVEKCLSFLKEEYEVNCLKPLQATINSSQFDKSKIDFSIGSGLKSKKKYIQKACLLYNHILEDSPYDQKGSVHYYRILRNRYLEHAKYFY